MSANAFVKRYFIHAYISIVYEYKSCSIYALYAKNGKIKDSEHKKFRSYDNSVPIEAANYVNRIISRNPFAYVTVLNEHISQSIMEMCEKDGIQKDGDYVWVCVDKKWGAVSKQEDIDEIMERHQKSGGVDFVYSPYVLLWHLIKEKPKEEKKMYILNIKSSVALVIADGENLEYGAFFAMLTNEMQSIEEIPDGMDEESESEAEDELSDDFEVEGDEEKQEEGSGGDGEDGLGELDGLESLDEATGLEEFEESDSAAKAKASEKEEGETIVDENAKNKDKFDEAQHEESFEEFARGVEIINQIKETMHDYYKNPNINSDFIDKIMIFDNTGLSEDTISYMSDVLLLDVEKENIEIGEVMNRLSKEEVDGNV